MMAPSQDERTKRLIDTVETAVRKMLNECAMKTGELQFDVAQFAITSLGTHVANVSPEGLPSFLRALADRLSPESKDNPEAKAAMDRARDRMKADVDLLITQAGGTA